MDKEKTKARREKYRQRHLKEEAAKIAKWRDDKHRAGIEFWTRATKLIDKNPIVIDNPFDLDLQFEKWDFDGKPIVTCYSGDGLSISRQDGYGGTILYIGNDAKKLFGKLL